ncbi:hypothetical protein MLD38_021728 [Melastoma candidum]|uniref:Uncharacterized protein n=1 Tax=Melastoma candidum TaxID=119954 RepID=A0ACB9QH26_9MYRT|nr:hypothetical protein MLD38_021728 [Melastoma candidum]
MHDIKKGPFDLKILLPTPPQTSLPDLSHMDVYNKKRTGPHIPTFGSWESYDGIPFTTYFESAGQRVFCHYSYSGDGDLDHRSYRAAIPFPRMAGRVKDSQESWAEGDDLEGFPRTRVARLSRLNSKPVDKDLYQIPVQFVPKKAKRKKQRSGFFTRCLLPVICV